MQPQHRATLMAESAETSKSYDASLHGVRLLIARIGWIAVAAIVLGLAVASLPAYFGYLHIVSGTSFYGPQLTPSDVRQLEAWGLSLDVYAWLNIGMFLLSLLVCTFIAILLFLRRPGDRMALLASLSLLFIPLGFNSQITGSLPSAWIVPIEVVTFMGNVCIGLFLFWFPSGQFAPRWAGWLMLVWLLYWANNQFLPSEPLNNTWIPIVPLFGLVASLGIFQVYRYRRVSTPLQRQQTKWVIFGIVLSFGGIVVALTVVDVLLPLYFTMSPLSFFFWQIPMDLLLLCFPLSIGFAISRNHLWEIDTLINRTLVYGLLTLLLAVVYVGLIIGLESLVGRFAAAHSGESIVIVVSTLVIAALFQPLRGRIQRVIDRQFYRSKYDASRTLEAFSATLRNEVDLATLSQQLVSVVEQTIQPEYVSLWLRSSSSSEPSAMAPGISQRSK